MRRKRRERMDGKGVRCRKGRGRGGGEEGEELEVRKGGGEEEEDVERADTTKLIIGSDLPLH